MGKRKNHQKGKAKILIAIISAIAGICTAYISLSHKTMNLEEKSRNAETETRKVDLEDNSGTIVNGDNNNVTISNDSDNEFVEAVSLSEKLLPDGGYSEGTVNDEWIYIYSDNGYEPIIYFQLLNENEITITINNIFIEVVDYKSFDKFVIDNSAGGADMLDIICWKCTISPQKTRYRSILVGTNENTSVDLSETKYVALKASDSGIFNLKLFPDTPGLYEAKLIVEYTSYKNEVKEISKNVKFIYDPKYEANYKMN